MLSQEGSVKYVRATWCGLNGVLKAKLICKGNDDIFVAKWDAGVPFTQDVIASGSGVNNEGEVRLVIDPSTLCPLPWFPQHERAMATFLDFPLDTRAWLSRLVASFEQQHSMQLKASLEAQFTLLRGSDAQGWHPVDSSTSCSADALQRSSLVLDDICQALVAQRVTVESVWSLSGAGQWALRWKEKPLLQAADTCLVVRETVLSVARKHNLKASFVPRLSPTSPPLSCPTRISFWREEISVSSLTLRDALSTPARFVGGLSGHCASLCGVGFSCALSYPRLLYAAGVCQGASHSECALCITQEGVVELRQADGICNPYVWLGCIVAAGQDGLINNGGEEKEEEEGATSTTTKTWEVLSSSTITKTTPKIPEDMQSSLAVLANDEPLMKALGTELSKCYIAVKKAEIECKAKDLLQVMLERF